MFFANGTSNSSLAMFRPTGIQQTVFTTVYEVVLPAACETSSWMATYTVTETCRGNPATFATAAIPPGFVVTTVSCGVCEETEMEITCPGAQPTGMGRATVHIEGNGITATMMASPATASAQMSMASAMPSGTGMGMGMAGPTAVPSHGLSMPPSAGYPVYGASNVSPASSNNNGMNSNNTMGMGMGGASRPFTGDAAIMTLKKSLLVGVGMAFVAPLLLV